MTGRSHDLTFDPAARGRLAVQERRARLAERTADTVLLVEAVVPEDRRWDAWELYRTSFEHLRATAVQRHVMTREEFDAVMTDARISKYTILDMGRGSLAAIGCITNNLAAMPLISPEYFAARWPRRYAEGRVFYIGFAAVHPDYHGTGIFARVVGSMCEVVAAVDGVASLDICRRNEEVFALPTAITRLVETFAQDFVAHRLDEQTYWAWEFGES